MAPTLTIPAARPSPNQQLPLPYVAQRAWNSALWLAEGVLQRAVPLPGHPRIRAVG